MARRLLLPPLLLLRAVQATVNPAATYCEENGGTTSTLYAPIGADGYTIICDFGDGSACGTDQLFYDETCQKGDPSFATYCDDNSGELGTGTVDWGPDGGAVVEFQTCTLDEGECAEYTYYETGCFPDEEPTTQPGLGMGDPSAIKCENDGGTSEIKYSPDGDQYALCIFEDGSACDTWAYFYGDCEEGNPTFESYCDDNGDLTNKSVDWGDVQGEPDASYEVCTFSDGSECAEYSYYGEGCFPPTSDTTIKAPTSPPTEDSTSPSTEGSTSPDTEGSSSSGTEGDDNEIVLAEASKSDGVGLTFSHAIGIAPLLISVILTLLH